MFQKLHARSVNLAALIITAGSFIWAYAAHIKPANSQTWAWLLPIGICLSLFATLFNYGRLLKITEAPTSSISAAAQGYIELYGTASTDKPFRTPYQSIPCVWYRAWVYANRYNEDGKRETRLLEYTESDQIFQLTDDSGSCQVNPKGAEIIYMEKRTSFKNDHRYVEEYLPAGKPLYLLGYLDTRHNFGLEETIKRDTGTLLTSWKTNPVKMLMRFDLNRDGKVDMQEWELARAVARREVEQQHLMKAHHGAFTLAKPADGKLFLISALSPQILRNRYQYWSLAHLFLLIILLMAYATLA
ncbi:MAG TPA: hypothetical protein VK949_02200 [Methylotenera sp.]|nr:hypothetical protein [Methylotenera sp.]